MRAMTSSAYRHTLSLARLLWPLALVLLCLSACASNTGLLGSGSWQSSGLPRQHIRALETNPANPQILYAGDTQDGVFVSRDDGQHWSRQSSGLPLPVSIYALAFDASGKKLYAASDKGLFVSVNGAQQWSAIGKNSLPADSYTALAFDYSTPGTIYVGTAHHGVVTSADSGNAWSASGSGLPTDTAVNDLIFDAGQHQLWTATNTGIYRSADSGKNWQALTNGLPPGLTVYAVYPISAGGGTPGLVIAGTNRGVFLSHNSGTSWERGKDPLAATTIRRILIDYGNAGTTYIGTSIGVFRSSDGGQIWSALVAGLPRGQSIYTLKLGGDSNSQLFAAANDVYQYPGSGSGLDITRLLPIVLIVVFFFLLYRFTRRNRTHRREVLQPANTNAPSTPAPPAEGQGPEKISSNGDMRE
ncbi:MAG: hypothetical protein H0W02_23785 [Ktedonobacteraceae bacterium]|nr:hypothetical protein [Ktedonobacteraceae bacterium]